jgi:hypothetical protein
MRAAFFVGVVRVAGEKAYTYQNVRLANWPIGWVVVNCDPHHKVRLV